MSQPGVLAKKQLEAGAETVQPDAPISVGRHEVRDIPFGPKRLNLVYIDQKADYQSNKALIALPESLRESGQYVVPLVEKLPTHKRDIEEPTGYPIVTPIFPIRYASYKPTADKEDYAACRPGFIYVFKNKHLWREFAVMNTMGKLREVNLTQFQGKDVRPANVKCDFSIYVPYQDTKSSKPNEIQVCYSEVQWSWVYIKRLGGMDKKDRRYVNELQKHVDTISPSDELRNKRMQTIDLTSYRQKQKTNPENSSVMPVGEAALQNRLSYLGMFAHTESPAVVLKDPVGLARDLAKAHQIAWAGMEILVKEATGAIPESEVNKPITAFSNPVKHAIHVARVQHMQKQQAYSKCAMILQHYFFSQDPPKVDPSLEGKEKDKEEEGVEKWNDWKGMVDHQKIKNTLLEEPRHKQRELIKKTRTDLIDFIDDTTSPYNFTIAMQDQVMLGSNHCYVQYETMNEILPHITDLPQQLDNYMDAKPADMAKEREHDVGNDLALRILGIHPNKPDHPLNIHLFPKELGDGTKIVSFDKGHIPPEEIRFKPDDFAKVEKAVLAALKHSIMLFASHLAKAEYIKSGNKKQADKHHQASDNATIAKQNYDERVAQQRKNVDQAQKVVDERQRSYDYTQNERQRAEHEVIRRRLAIDDLKSTYPEVSNREEKIALAQKRLKEAEVSLEYHKKNEELALRRLNEAQKELAVQKSHLATVQAESNSPKPGTQNKYSTTSKRAPAKSASVPLGRLMVLSKQPIAQVELPADAANAGITPEGTAPLRIKQIHDRIEQMDKEGKRGEATKQQPRDIAVQVNGKSAGFTRSEDLRHFTGEWAERSNMASRTEAEVEQSLKGKKVRVFVALSDELPVFDSANEMMEEYEKRLAEIESNAKTMFTARTEAGKQLREAFKTWDKTMDVLKKTPMPSWLNVSRLKSNSGRYGLLTLVSLYELWNFKEVSSKFKSSNYLSWETLALASAAVDVAAVSAQWAEYARYAVAGENKVAMMAVTEKVRINAKSVGKAQAIAELKSAEKATWKTLKFAKFAAWTGFGASVISIPSSLHDMIVSIESGNAGKALGDSMIFMATVGMAVSGGAALYGLITTGATAAWTGPVGWIAFGVLIAGAIIAYIFSEDRMETWIRHSLWGTGNPDAFFNGNADTFEGHHEYWATRPGLMYNELMDCLFRPSIRFIPRNGNDPIAKMEVRFPVFSPGAQLELNWADAAGTIQINSDFEVDEKKLGYSWFHLRTRRYLTCNMLYNKNGQMIGKDYYLDLGKSREQHMLLVQAKFYPEGKEASLVNDKIVIPEPKRKKSGEAEGPDIISVKSRLLYYNPRAMIPPGSATTKMFRRPQ